MMTRRVESDRPMATLVLTWLGRTTAVLLALAASVEYASASGQRVFASPEAAVQAVVDAAAADDTAMLLAIFGPESREIVTSGDAVADDFARERFAARATERTDLTRIGDDFAVLSVGTDDWPFPVPMMKDARGWYFYTAAGKEELLNRRIGRNELSTMQVCREYVDAQRDYASRMQRESRDPEYAQRLYSRPGTHDGLYWETGDGEEESPVGPFLAGAASEGYGRQGHLASRAEPFHGYVLRILTGQGPAAPGGARSYVENGRMTGGFALLAYPAVYGSTGIKTFIVNQLGVVYEKDLGPRTATIAGSMVAYDPDGSWHPAD